MKYKVFPYKMASQSARRLANALGVKRVYPDRKYKQKPNHLVINWGNSTPPKWAHLPYPMMNDYAAVHTAINKLLFFKGMAVLGITPEYTQQKAVAQIWLDEGTDVIARDSLTGSGGKDAHFYLRRGRIEGNHVLYTKYIPKCAEYRVHVFNGQVIHLQEKRRRRGVGAVDNKIRNHERGWVFCQENVEAPPSVSANAITTINHLGLMFGAVDIVYNQHYNKSVVLECNTAPGLVGDSTLDAYVKAFNDYI